MKLNSLLMLTLTASALVACKGGDRPTVVMLGDSLTEMRHWEQPGCNLVNMGVGGNTTAQMLARLPDVVAQKPKAVFIMGGINDIAQGVPLETIVANLVTMQKLLGFYGVVGSIHQVLPVAQSKGWQDKVNQLNAMLQTTFHEKADTFGYAGSYQNPAISLDGLHFTPDGYAQLKQSMQVDLDEACSD